MQTYVVVEGGVVVNRTRAALPLAENWVASETAQIGDLYQGGEFVRPPAPPTPVPASVTQRQARLMLHRQGVLAGVDAVIDAMPEPAKTEARIEWEYASAIVRTSPLVAAMGAALSLDDAGLDALFIAAAAL